MPRHTSLQVPCCCYVFACSISSFDCPCLLSSRFPIPSDAPGKHRRAFVAQVRVAVPLYSTYHSMLCSNLDFYVLPRILSAPLPPQPITSPHPQARAALTIHGNTDERVGWGGGGRGGGVGIAGHRGGLLVSSAKVSDPAVRSPVQKQEMPARGSS